MNGILDEIKFLENLSSELSMLRHKIDRMTELVISRSEKRIKEIRKFEEKHEND
jgi:hypothetical protein